jgi:hypothetical protein
MDNFDLLDAVLPEGGWFAVVGIKGKSVVQKIVETREEVDSIAEKFVEQKRNVFFGCSKFATDANRKKDNVLSTKAFWLDVDCAPGKEQINPDTGVPFGYIDQPTGLAELHKFCETTGLPSPTIVSSGRGLHVYWILTEPLGRKEWETTANRLREMCSIQGFYVDPGVFEVSRVLRIPGTFNFKNDPPYDVKVLSPAPPVEHAELKRILGVKERAPLLPPTELVREKGLSALTQSLLGNTVQKFKNIMIRGDDGCKQLVYAYRNRASIPEPLWWSSLTVANECVDRIKAIHMMSEGHPDYDPTEAVRKAEQGGGEGGPHRCETFERHNPGGCKGCKWKGKIAGPIALSKEVVEDEEPEEVEAQPEEAEVDEDGEPQELLYERQEVEEIAYKIPPYPKPYVKGKNGAIYLPASGEEAEPICIYEHALYVVKRMTDPSEGEIVLLRLHLPQDGVKEFTAPLAVVVVKEELRKVLAKQGVAGTATQMNHLASFVLAFVKNMQYQKKADTMRNQFGWVENNSKFILGSSEVTKDGIFSSPPSSTTKKLAQDIGPVGSFEKWKEAFNMYARPGMEPYVFATLTAFGAPLFRFTGLKGAVVNVIYKHGGTGKSTTLFMCNSVYGSPEGLASMWKDTYNSKILQLGVMNNLPFTLDEMTNISAEEFSDLAYGMSQGRDKNRMKGMTNELRVNNATWQTISLASSNASFYEKMTMAKQGSNAEMLRLFEYEIPPNDFISTEEGKRMFDRQLKENYGHAGEVYIQWLVNNLEEAVSAMLRIQQKIDKELRLTPPERFWSAIAACNITGGLLARNLGLHEYDMKALYSWVCNTIQSIREDTKPPMDDVMGIIGDYINRHMQNILVVKAETDKRTSMPVFPTLEPRGELLIRYEPDTKHMYFVTREFKQDCVERQISYKDTIRQLRSSGFLVDTPNKRMSKGMKITSPAVHTLMFDCSKSGFIDIDGMIASEIPNEDREGELQH